MSHTRKDRTMKHFFTKALAILFTAVFAMNISFACAEEWPVTPTDLAEDAGENREDYAGSAEVIVTKIIRVGDTWQGRVREAKPAILKLDIDKAGTVYLIVESRERIRASVVKSDRPEENLQKSSSDAGKLVLSWNAERGSYLIEIGPDAPGGSAGITARVLDNEGYAAWMEAEQKTEAQPEEEPEEAEPEELDEEPEKAIKPDGEPKADSAAEGREAVRDGEPTEPGMLNGEPEADSPAEEQEDNQEEETAESRPAERSVRISLAWETDDPQIGDTAHFSSVMTGYDNLTYSLQWQTSRDGENWTDYTDATEPQLDVVLTEELNEVFFRLVVYVESEQEG